MTLHVPHQVALALGFVGALAARERRRLPALVLLVVVQRLLVLVGLDAQITSVRT